MELEITAKQRKAPRYYNDHKVLARALNKINGVEKVICPERIPNRKGIYTVFGHFNVSDVHQKITSSGYSVLKAPLTQEKEATKDPERLAQWTMEVKQVVDKIKQQRYEQK